MSNYLKGYSAETIKQAEAMLDANKVGTWLLGRYPVRHSFASERALYDFTQALKNQYMKSSSPISKVCYDDKIHVIDNALGLHKFVSRVQGNKLKAKNEIKISSLFRAVPEPFLRMIVVHELSHLREKSHDKAFYKLCNYMEPNYHQLEFEVRLYLAHKEHYGELWI